MDYILEVKDLEKKREGFQLHNMSFNLRAGYFYAVAGCNGAGKTSLFNLLLGINRPTSGSIKVCGYDLLNEPEKAKQHIAYILSDCPFSIQMSAKANAKIYGSCYDTFDYSKFEENCKRFEVPLKKPLHKLSKGMNIKFQLAFALSYDAKLFLLDEPTEGLDPVFRREFMDIILDIIATGEKTILMSSQLTEEFDQVADYLMLLEKGKMKIFDAMEQLRSDYQIINGTKIQISYLEKESVVAVKENGEQAEALVKKSDSPIRFSVTTRPPVTEDFLAYMGGK